jgi:very-short-patch-repair endonuclease
MAKRRTPSRSRSKSKSTLCESDLESAFLTLCQAHSFPTPTQQHQFHPQRQWRLDFAWPSSKLAVEIQGYGPGHNSYVGMSNDYEKHNEAILLGWRFLYFMAHDLNHPNTISTANTVRLCLGITTPSTSSVPNSTVSDSQTYQSYLDRTNSSRGKLDQIANQRSTD